MAENVLEVRELAVEFHSAEGPIHAVNDVSFYVRAGETLGVVGESGSGKSVTLLSIVRLVRQPPGRIVNGEVLFDGKDLLQASEKSMRAIRGREISMIFQDGATYLNPILTIERQITEALQRHRNMNRSAARARAIELLDMVGIGAPDQRIFSYPHQLSGGMRQRCMIAMAIACDPRVLLADEPTTALDATIQAQILDLVRTIRAALGLSVVWVSHDLGVVAELADRVIVMYAGRVAEQGSAQRLFTAPRHPYTQGLLAAMPRDSAGSRKLTSIEGGPPDPLQLQPGCAFYDRCSHRIDRCRLERPPLAEIDADHAAACWVLPERNEVF